MVYNDEPIEAVFHAVSAGKTQSAKDVWKADIPYLISVDSNEDVESPNYEKTIEYTINEIQKIIKNQKSDFKFYTTQLIQEIQIISRSEAGYVTSIQIGNKIFTGEELRSFLDLPSSNFTIEIKDDKIIIICKGYGHGVGLSQYGANYKAKEGLKYKEILNIYYPNTKMEKVE